MVVYSSDEEALGQIGIVFFEKGCNGYDPKMISFFWRDDDFFSIAHIISFLTIFLFCMIFFLC
jgi:hypothetical protein